MTPVTDTKTMSSPRKGPSRTCVGCGAHGAPEELVRLVAGPAGDGDDAPLEIAVDLAGGAFGRGAHVHAAPECLAKACKGGLARAFKAKIVLTKEALAALVVDAADRRVAGLVSGARRARHVAIGADAVADALAASGASPERHAGSPLVLVARDAGAIAGRADVRAAAAAGRAVGLLDKSALGALLGREEVAVAAVLEAGIANEIKRIYSMADAVRATRGRLEV